MYSILQYGAAGLVVIMFVVLVGLLRAEQTRSKIRAVLTDEQRKKYDEFNAANEARRNKQKSQPQHSN